MAAIATVDFHERYHETRGLIPEGNLASITYEDLRADPVATLREVYEQLNLGDFTEFEPGLAALLDTKKGYRTNTYDLPEDLEEQVWTQWRDYFDEYGYKRMADRA